MFKKPFNRTIGEIRVCRQCNEEFHAYKPIWSCMACLCKQQKLYAPRITKKDKYPFSGNERDLRFSRIHGELSRAWKQGREALTAHYDKQLKEIEQNGVLDWINDRRSAEAKKENRVKSRNNITKDYPNHHDYYEY